MKKQNAGLIALSIVFILMGGFSTIYNLSKYVSNRVFMSSAEKTTGYVKWIDHELKTWGHNKKASNKAETYYITVAFDVGGKGVHKRDLHRHVLCESERKSERVLQHK